MNDAALKDLVRRCTQYVVMYNALLGFANEKGDGWNSVSRELQPTDHMQKSVRHPSNDTLMVRTLLDVRTEPIVVHYPAFDSGYVSLETIGFDHYCEVPLSSTRGDFAHPTTVLYYSARTKSYRGEPVPGVDLVQELTSDFCLALVRVMPHFREPRKFRAIRNSIESIKLLTLSEFQGKPAPSATQPNFPKHFLGDDEELFANNLLEVMQFVANHTTFDPDNNSLDRHVLSALKSAGVKPGRTYHQDTVADIDGARIRAIVQQVRESSLKDRSRVIYDRYLPKGEMTLDAMVFQSVTGACGLPATEAVHLRLYPADGNEINAMNDYVIRMLPGRLPPSRAFWSLTVYDRKSGLLLENDYKKYSVGKNAGMRLDEAGGIEIHIGPERPEGVPGENWLPTPREDLPLTLILRMYDPELDRVKKWDPPQVYRK